ncbi:MAG: UPF0058 family protein [Halobacteria archaeon]
MHKEELIHLHEVMSDIKDYFDESNQDVFENYEDLDLDHDDIHQSKSAHKHAIFVLGQEMAEKMSEDEFSDRGRISQRMEELAEKNAE